MKKVVVQFTFPGMQSTKYDQAWEELRARGITTIPGLIFHVGTKRGNDWVVVDVWESEAAFKKFGETTLGPILAKLDVPQVQPVITPVHYLHVGQLETV